jgi:hypothetical protein
MTKVCAISIACAIGLTTSAVTAQASTTVYTSQFSFAAATSAITNYDFTFADTKFISTSYWLGPVTFSSTTLQDYKDAYVSVPGGVAPYLSSSGGLVTINSTTDVLGLNLGSYLSTQTVTYTIDGVNRMISVPTPDATTFIGFVSSTSVQASFTYNDELDTIRFLRMRLQPFQNQNPMSCCWLASV